MKSNLCKKYLYLYYEILFSNYLSLCIIYFIFLTYTQRNCSYCFRFQLEYLFLLVRKYKTEMTWCLLWCNQIYFSIWQKEKVQSITQSWFTSNLLWAACKTTFYSNLIQRLFVPLFYHNTSGINNIHAYVIS